MTFKFEILPYWTPIYHEAQLTEILYWHFKDLRDLYSHLCYEAPADHYHATVHCKSIEFFQGRGPTEFFIETFATPCEQKEFDIKNNCPAQISFQIEFRNEVPYYTIIKGYREGEYFFDDHKKSDRKWILVLVDIERELYVARHENRFKVITGHDYVVVSDYFDADLKPQQFLHEQNN